jgi:hypothetical protein
MPRQSLIQLRRGSKSQWVTANPILDSGELGLETDSGRLKIGDGSKAWIFLDYIGTSENLTKIKNNTGYAIQKGQAVYISGNDSYLNTPSVSPYLSNGSISEQLFCGLMSDYVSNTDYGFVINFGILSGLNTTGSISNIADGSESWIAGDTLYVHPSDYGKLTKNKPEKNIILVGMVTFANSTSGNILVRSFINPRLSQLNEIYFNSVSNHDLIQYDQPNSRWRNINELDGGIV